MIMTSTKNFWIGQRFLASVANFLDAMETRRIQIQLLNLNPSANNSRRNATLSYAGDQSKSKIHAGACSYSRGIEILSM